ncbi:MAG: AMIN domain-containing protein [Aphanothece sp. CMT-3BRIN-NPC111]|jgi:N-acetylmuramoyl-L-alanine amidase|nr:AMIN domain-containing protein [Aphanothece sp. CMT-3BRIN-NPC111]
MSKQKSIWEFWSSMKGVKTLSLTSVSTAVAVCCLALSAQGASLTSWRFDPATNQLEINLNEATMPRYFLASQPPRIVIDLPRTQLGRVERQKTYLGSVRLIKVTQLEGNVTRIVLELSPQVVLAPEEVQLFLPPESDGNRWLLRSVITEKPNTSSTSAPTILPTTLPPASFTTPQTPVVKVPPLNRNEASTSSTSASANTMPPAIFVTNQAPRINVPVLQPETAGAPVPTASVIEFGQPLPNTRQASVTLPSSGTGSNFSRVLLPAGTLIKLRYPGKNILKLQVEKPIQEVLLLHEEIRDRTGKILAPSGTPIIGRFETDSSGSRFITQAIILGRDNVPLVAQSEILGGNQQRASSRIAPNSTSTLNAPQPTNIQPGQILQVQIAEDGR